MLLERGITVPQGRRKLATINLDHTASEEPKYSGPTRTFAAVTLTDCNRLRINDVLTPLKAKLLLIRCSISSFRGAPIT